MRDQDIFPTFRQNGIFQQKPQKAGLNKKIRLGFGDS
jgi:hypothetical protein